MAFAALFQPQSARDLRPSDDANVFANLFEPTANTAGSAPEIVEAAAVPEPPPEQELLLRRSDAEPQKTKCRGILPWIAATSALLLLVLVSKPMTGSNFKAFTMERWEEKLPTCNEFPKLDFLWVAHSNLNNMGPDHGEEGLVYRVRSYKGEHMEMVFNAIEDFEAFDPKMFGLHGFYGSLNVMELSAAHIMVTFRDWETKKRVKMEEFGMTFFDIDQGFNGAGIEEVMIQGDWTVALVSHNTGVEVEHSPHFRRIKFRSTLPGMAMDSPVHPLTLTKEQFHKAVTIRFNDVDSFKMRLSVLSIGAHHRFFEFAGEASILCAHLPMGGAERVGKAYWNPREHAPPGLIPKKPFETVAKTTETWVFEGWQVVKGAAVHENDVIFGGKIVVGENTLHHNSTLKSPGTGTVTQLLPELREGQHILPNVGVAIIAFPIVRPPGLEVEENTRAKFDIFAVTEHAYRIDAFHVKKGQHIKAGHTIFSGHPVKGTKLGHKVHIKATASGRVEAVLETLHPGHFVLKDVVMFQLRPRVIYPPGLHKIGGVKDDHIIKNEFAIRFQEWKVHDYDIVKPGQVLLTYHNTHHFLGSDDLHEVRSTVSGWVSHRLKSGHVWQGDIIDAHVGLIRIRDEASFPEVPEPEVQVNHGDLPSSPSDEEPWRRMEVAMLAVGGVLGLIVVIFAICYFWLEAPPPPKPPPPKPEIISVTTTETVTVNNGGISTTPTDQHYSHVVHVRHHHHGSHTH